MPRTNDRISAEWERRIRRAARSRDHAVERYYAVLAEAIDAGVSQAAIARAAGVTRSAINKAPRRSIPDPDIPPARQAPKVGETE